MKLCGAKTRSGGRCRKTAGWGTDHPGTGKCRLHGGASPIKHGRYSSVKRELIRRLIEQHADDPDPLDVLPEIAAARALFQDFVERYDEWREAFLAWHESFNRTADTRSADDDGNPLPTKPRQVLDLSDAVRHLKTIAQIAQAEKRLALDDAVGRKDLGRIIAEMRRAVEAEVSDPDTLRRISDAWNTIRLA
ncbi:MAG: HGGxSTG domain-containing protein [Bacteroidota bacterium]